MNRLLAPFFARSLLRNSTETLATQATTIGNECILDRPIYTELKFSESCCHFSFFLAAIIYFQCLRTGRCIEYGIRRIDLLRLLESRFVL